MRTTLRTAVACLLLATAGCGGNGGGGGEAEFIAQVNAVCADYGPRLELIPPPAESIEEWTAVGADLADLLEASTNQLRLLEPPEGLSEGYADWIGLRTEMATSMRAVQTAGGLLDDAAVDAGLERVDAAIAEADPLAEELGFDECSPTGLRTA